MTDENRSDHAQQSNTPNRDNRPTAEPIEAAGPDAFGLVQAWYGNGKGKTTAALGMGLRAAGHGHRVHVLQFMKGGTDSVEATRGEYNAIAQLPGVTVENSGHYGWHGLLDDSDDDEHAATARAAFERARELVDAAGEAELSAPLALDGDPEAGVHMLILDEVLYAANRGLVDPEELLALIDARPAGLELVLTGGHERPDYLDGHVDLLSHVAADRHPFEADGQRARKGTEY